MEADPGADRATIRYSVRSKANEIIIRMIKMIRVKMIRIKMIRKKTNERKWIGNWTLSWKE